MRKTTSLLFLSILLTACAGAGPSPVPSPAPSPNPSPQPSPEQSPEPGAGFYLRAWYQQALPPVHIFTWLPVLTIDDETVIDGNVAVPAIYPGPLLIMPFARSITPVGITAIIDEATRLGLLGGVTDFTGGAAMPGSRTGHIQIVVNGVTHELVGNPDTPVRCQNGRCDAQVASPEAFAAFWQQLTFLDGWMGGELGPSNTYVPERVAVLFVAPAPAEPGLQQPLATWPLSGSFDLMGVEFPGEQGARCVTLSGEDLELALPVLQAANQLTVFHDEVDGQRSAMVVVVVAGAESPCPDEALIRSRV